MTLEALIEQAQRLVGEYPLSHPSLTAAAVGSALLSSQGNLYTGVNMSLFCGIGFCAEHAAVVEMLKHRETRIAMVVAIKRDYILPPCGRCREMMLQVDRANAETQVILPGRRVRLLKELMPDYWMHFNQG